MTPQAETVELYGLLGCTNGRSCERHTCCGESVILGDILRIKRTVVTINGSLDDAIKFVSIVDGCEKCTVGFVSKALFSNMSALTDKFVEVVEFYGTSPNSFKRRKSNSNKGMALCRLVDSVEGVQSYD
jgi:hypothetical protein